MVDLIMGSVCYNISNLSYTDCCCYLVTKSCLTLLCDPMDCSLLGSSVRFSRHTLPWAWLYPFCEAGMLGHLIRPISQQYAAAAAKSLQSCLTLCNSRDGSPPGSPVPGILQARTLEWVAISFSNAWKWKVKSLSRVWPSATDPMDCSLPGSSIYEIFQARILEWGAIDFSVTTVYIPLNLTQCLSLQSWDGGGRRA